MKFKTLLIGFGFSLLFINNPGIIKAETGTKQFRENFAVYNAEELIDGAFLHDFMLLGPFPNPLPEGFTEYFHTDEECIGFATDYLKSAGGENGVKPYVGQSVELRIKPEPLFETYQLIKQEDPDHLVITNHDPVNLISTLARYNRSTDIVACDVYPVIPHGIRPTYALYPDGLQGDLLNPYICQVGEYADKMKKVVNHSRFIFMN